MKRLRILFCILWLYTCSGGGGNSPTEPETPTNYIINLANLAGQAQKGPFNNGTSITIAELTSALSPTGRNFSSAIVDNSGRFNISNVQLVSPYVELRANGFYFNEVNNSLSDAQLTLFSLSNLTNKTSLNVNILTHLEKNRVANLISSSTTITFAQAKIQAQEEVLNIFDLNRNNMPESEMLDISKSGESNAKLLAISAIIQGQLTVAQMSELLANISSDISSDGILNNQQLIDTLLSNSKNLDLAKIRANLEARFTALGISASIPNFEEQVNQFLKPPIANDITASTDEDVSLNISLDASDPENDELTFSILETNNATVTLNGNLATYTPDANFNGTDTFTYFANDGTTNSNTATVTIEVGAVDDEPQTNDIDIQTDEDVALFFNLTAEEYDGDSYSFTINTQPTNGSINLDGVSVTYTPNQNFNGTDTFTFEATDDSGRTINVATATITVNPVNDAPVANDITSQVTDENRMMQLDITLDATDVDGDALTYSVTSTNNGSVTINDNIATYVPTQDWNGEDTFTYVANDGSLDSNVATVTITVNAVNDAPVVYDHTSTGEEDTDNAGTAFNYLDIDGDELTFSIVTQPTNGSVSIREDGYGFEHTPDANWNGTDTFTFKANDGELDSNIGTMTLIITPVNDAPEIESSSSLETDEDIALSIDLNNYATDIDGDDLTFNLSYDTENASWETSEDNADITMTPNENWSGAIVLTFTANDGELVSNASSILITVNAVNDAPVASDGTDSNPEDTRMYAQLSATDVDTDVNKLSYYIVTAPENVTLCYDAPEDFDNGECTNVLSTGDLSPSAPFVIPDTNWNGTTTFTWKANDGTDDSNIATNTISFDPVDDEPVTNNIAVDVDEDSSIDITLTAEEYDGDTYSFSIIDQPSNGSLTLSGIVASYTPNENYNGSDSFTFEATDDTGRSMNVATASITINPVNDAPVTSDVATGTDEDTSVVINLVGSDVENDNLTFNIESTPSNGSVVIVDNTAIYTPNKDYNGTDKFTYSANDGELTSNISSVIITINEINDAPTVEDVRVTINENRLITTNFDEKESSDIKFTINSNRSGSVDIALTADDPEGDTLVFSIVETNAGAVSLEDNIATYTPSQDWNGVDTFSFKAFDGQLESNVAKVILSVNPQNDAPTVKDMTITTSEDTDIEFILDGTDIDGDNLQYSIVTDVVIGDNNIVLENNTGPNVIFEPGNNWYGTEQFTYRANDGSLDSNVAQVTLVVSSVNDAPTANDVTATVSETRTARSYFTLDGSDVDGDVLEYIITENVSNGTVSLNGAEVNYVPSQDFVGQDTLKYKVNDGVLDSNIAAAYITISAVNDAPVAEEIYSSVDEDSSVEITLKASDVESESLNYYVSKSSLNATLEQVASKITYAPNTDFYGYDSFQYYAVDEDSQVSNIATVHVNVSPMEDSPKLEDTDTTIYYTLEYGVPDTISFTNFPDVDPDGDAVTYYFKGDSTKYSFSSTTQDTLYCIDCSGENSASIYGIDEKGNQGASSAFTVNLIGGPQGLAAVEEYTAGYLENNELRDPSVSYVPWASLGRTGYIIENRAGEVNATPYARDFDRFNYWTEQSQFHIELDFSQESLAWDYITEAINGYVPFTAYLIDAFDNSKEQLFAGYWEGDGESGFSNPGDGTQWAGPVYGAAAWEPIYLFLPQDGVVYGDEAQYINDNDLETSGGIGWASSNPRELRSSLDFGDPPSVIYPLMTATLFTAYMSGSTLPTADGHASYGSGYDGASSVVFKTSFEIYDNPDGTNNSRNSMENTFDPSSEEVLLPQMNFNRKFSSDEFMYEQGIEQ